MPEPLADIKVVCVSQEWPILKELEEFLTHSSNICLVTLPLLTLTPAPLIAFLPLILTSDLKKKKRFNNHCLPLATVAFLPLPL